MLSIHIPGFSAHYCWIPFSRESKVAPCSRPPIKLWHILLVGHFENHKSHCRLNLWDSEEDWYNWMNNSLFRWWFSEKLLPSPSMSMLQASPSPFPSVSVCCGLVSNGQLSQRSPTPSLSESNCRGLYTSGQLSYNRHIFLSHTQHFECRLVFSLCLVGGTSIKAPVSPSRLGHHRCHHQDHRRLPLRHGQNLPVRSLVLLGSYPAANHNKK